MKKQTKKREGIWCSRCQTTEGPFIKYSKKKNGRQYYHCRRCHADIFSAYYYKHKQRILDANKRYLEKKKNLEK
jgi:transposase-like protein